ncbi:hypothetical protein ACTXPD_17870 [Vreelandella alkaliphila]|uniref:hypothetical protein n=1 Tax=Vreelandella alkaliphila TaxID=272774 RepID=UPI003FD7914F
MHSLSKITLFAAALAFGPLPAFSQSINDGFEAYQRGDYATALESFEPLAEQGLVLD